MTANENGAVVRRFIDEVFNRGDFSTAREVLAADYVHHDPATAEQGSGIEGLQKMVDFYRQAFPDFSVQLDDQIVAGDKVVERWTGRGTHRGALMGAAATGKTITATGISIHRLSGGKIAETWTIFDTATMLRQVGLVPGQA